MSGYLIDDGLGRDTILDLVSRVETLETSLAATQASIAAAEAADREVPLWPFQGANWALRTGFVRDSSAIRSTSLSAQVEWVWRETKMGFLTNAIVRVTDTAGKPGLPITVHWLAGGAGPLLLGTVTSAGSGATQDLQINFGNAVEGPGYFVFGALTPGSPGPPGTYSILRCRVRA